MPSSGGQRSRELFSPAANRAEQAQTLATQETKWKESQRRHSTQAANVRMEPGKPDSGPIGLNAIALPSGDPRAEACRFCLPCQPPLTSRSRNKKRRFRVKWLYAEPAGNPKLTARKDPLTLRRFFKGNALSLAAAGQQAQRAQAQQREAGGLGGRDREPQGVARRAGVLIGAAGVA